MSDGELLRILQAAKFDALMMNSMERENRLCEIQVDQSTMCVPKATYVENIPFLANKGLKIEVAGKNPIVDYFNLSGDDFFMN